MINNTLNNILQNFRTISLQEMDKVNFMNRIDSKFVFSIHHLAGVLNDCLQEYKVLEINNTRNHFYDSLYFDTKDYMMYQLHHNQRLNRYKIRYRKYFSSDGLSFFEIKFKDNKEKTYKKRKKQNDIQYEIGDELKEFLSAYTPFQQHELLPSLRVQYKRITLVHQNLNERVTIDTELYFDNFSAQYRFDNLVVAEVKRNNYSEHTTFLKILKNHHIREGGLSKYCTGMALTTPFLKRNNFSLKLRYFEKINSV